MEKAIDSAMGLGCFDQVFDQACPQLHLRPSAGPHGRRGSFENAPKTIVAICTRKIYNNASRNSSHNGISMPMHQYGGFEDRTTNGQRAVGARIQDP